jgi:hypothetical protein
MDFVKYINTPKNTKATDPLITKIKLTKGRLTGGFLYFPAGPAGTLRFLAKVGRHQIIPFNAGESYRLDDCVIPFHFNIWLRSTPFEISCITWNASTLYDHALTVGFFLQPKSKRNKDIDTLAAIRQLSEGYHKP